MKENLLSVVISLVLATVLFFVLRLTFGSSLQTNILQSQQEELLGDVVVETYERKISLGANQDLSGVVAMSIMLFFDPEEVDIDLEKTTGVGETQVLSNSGGRINLFINQIVSIEKGDVIFESPVVGDATKIVVSDVVLQFQDDSSERASVSMR